MRVKVLRPFCLKGERQEPGKEIEFAEVFARELIFLGKAERVGDAASAASPAPLTTKSAPELVSGAARKKGGGTE